MLMIIKKGLHLIFFISRHRDTIDIQGSDATDRVDERVKDGGELTAAHDGHLPSLSEVELEHNIWDFTNSSSIIDSLLFNDDSQ